MRLTLLPGLLLALAGGVWGDLSPHTADISSVSGFVQNIAGSYSIAAQTETTATTTIAVTSTAAVTGTSTTTSTIGQSTPAPLPAASPGANLQLNPFDWNFLTGVANPPLGPFGWAYLVIMSALLAASAYFYFVKRIEWKRTNSVLRRAADRWGQVGMWIGGLGLLFLIFRVIQLDFFNLRFWFYLWLWAAIGSAILFFYWYRTRYPKEMAKYLKTQRARQYMPGVAKKGALSQAAATPPRGGNTPPAQAAKAETPHGEKKRRRR